MTDFASAAAAAQNSPTVSNAIDALLQSISTLLADLDPGDLASFAADLAAEACNLKRAALINADGTVKKLGASDCVKANYLEGVGV
jgi:hypothetical protein